ncbi:hypothetical protein B9Z55_003547 [Caenorhabditis nigoni]|uniref:Uncharacterized protein n=1 Tax=Caenorhabditis nigoni TaxID=1611254 RepID=A0A2G5VQZ7_9PELO|nr:hypothetical protein B9Z55_003547 [Caenorhabditis nigoni]
MLNILSVGNFLISLTVTEIMGSAKNMFQEPYRVNKMANEQIKVQEFKNHIRVYRKQEQSVKEWYQK